MSDINPPSTATRSRKTKRAPGTTIVKSVVRKTKSEPLLITLDDSDCNYDPQSSTSNRPTRSARIQGELTRKFNSMSDRKKTGCSSSSSSDSNTKGSRKPAFTTKDLFAKRLLKKQNYPLRKESAYSSSSSASNTKGSPKPAFTTKDIVARHLLKKQNQKLSLKKRPKIYKLLHANPKHPKSVKMENRPSKSLQDTPDDEEDPAFPAKPPPPKKLGRPKKTPHWTTAGKKTA